MPKKKGVPQYRPGGLPYTPKLQLSEATALDLLTDEDTTTDDLELNKHIAWVMRFVCMSIQNERYDELNRLRCVNPHEPTIQAKWDALQLELFRLVKADLRDRIAKGEKPWTLPPPEFVDALRSWKPSV